LAARTHPSELADARRFVADDELDDYVRRSRDARLRVSLLEAFYTRFPCRMSALHLLGAGGIAIARFAAVSEVYGEIGDRLLPIDRQGQPRTERWREYVRAFELGQPADLLEEHWLRAHLEDMEAVKAQGWVEAFHEERARFPDDATWALLEDHMLVTLGVRVDDAEALSGQIALETALMGALWTVLARTTRITLSLVRTFVLASVRGVLHGGPRVPPHLPSDRSLVWTLCRATALLVRMARVAKLARRRRSRGALPAGGAWSLMPSLNEVLGPDAERLHPRVAQLFDRMDSFRLTASVHLDDARGRWAAWFATLLVGQGMYEHDLEEVDARFQLFRRDDGSLHFVREFWCADEVRVFDSDFVVRQVDGRPTLLEVFGDLKLAAQMHTEVLDDGGIAMTIRRLFVRGIPIGVGPVRVCFETRPDGDDLDVEGVMDVGDGGGLMGWLLRRLLPRRVGAIRYRASPVAEPSTA